MPALYRISSIALEEGWGMKKLLEKLRTATGAGKHKPRSYTQYEIDLTILLYELGGSGAVYAVNHSHFILPSLKVIQPYRRQN